MEISAGCEAEDMDTICSKEVLQPLHSQQQQQQQVQSSDAYAKAPQQVTLAEAAVGAYEALAAATAAVTELAANLAASDAVEVMPAVAGSDDGPGKADDDDLMLDWVCPDLQALLAALYDPAASTSDVTQLHAAMSR